MPTEIVINCQTGEVIEREATPIILTYDEQVATVEAKYAPKFALYKELIRTAMASDGADRDTKIAAFSAKYNEQLALKNAEVEAIPYE